MGCTWKSQLYLLFCPEAGQAVQVNKDGRNGVAKRVRIILTRRRAVREWWTESEPRPAISSVLGSGGRRREGCLFICFVYGDSMQCEVPNKGEVSLRDVDLLYTSD